MRSMKEYYRVEIYNGKNISLFKRIIAKHFEPSTNAVYLIRKMQYWKEAEKRTLIKPLAIISYKRYQLKLAHKYGIYINRNVEIDIGLKLPHPTSIVIGTYGIGKYATIYQNVTVGSAHIGDYKLGRQPVIGDNVVLFAGSTVIGDIQVKDGTIVAAGAILNKSTDENCVYAGVPAKKINSKLENV